MEKSFDVFGRAVVVAGVTPFLLWVVLNVTFFGQLTDLLEPEFLPIMLAVSAGGGILLFVLNTLIIHWYEGAFAIQRRWLLAWAQRRNQRRHEQLYHPLLNLREMRQEVPASVVTEDGPARAEEQRRVDSVLLAIDQLHEGLEKQQANRLLPVHKAFVTPTALGNAYAVMEEYPYERYGIDSMVFWPRLIAVLPTEYRASIADQKTSCDFLLNTSLMLSIFAVEAVGAGLLPAVLGLAPQPTFLVLALLSLSVAYGFYRVAVSETHVLGKLVASAFDLYRHTLLRQLGFEPPAHLSDESRLWQRLAAFIRRGEAFYHPTSELILQNGERHRGVHPTAT